MRAGAAEDLRPRGLRASRIAEGARVGDRLVRLGKMEDPRAGMNLLGAEPEGISLPVPPLVVLDDDLAGLLEIGNAGEHPVAQLGMALHLFPLLGRERTALAEDGVGNADLAHVVDERRLLDGGEGVL